MIFIKSIIETNEVAKILQENQDLTTFISHAKIKLKNYFGITPLYLETVGDGELLMSVATKLSPEDALKKLHQFDNEWWIEHEPLSEGKLCIDVVSI